MIGRSRLPTAMCNAQWCASSRSPTGVGSYREPTPVGEWNSRQCLTANGQCTTVSKFPVANRSWLLPVGTNILQAGAFKNKFGI